MSSYLLCRLCWKWIKSFIVVVNLYPGVVCVYLMFSFMLHRSVKSDGFWMLTLVLELLRAV